MREPSNQAANGSSSSLSGDAAGDKTRQAFENLFTVQELARLWSLSTDTVRRLFQREPGTVVLTHHRPGRRTYRTLRIPQSVAERVYRRLTT